MTNLSAGSGRATILFFAEAVTLAHVARPVVLAAGLDPQQFDVHLAHDPRYRALLGDLACTEHTIRSISPQQFMDALAKGAPVYDYETLTSYVEEDLRVIRAVEPDIIVGDFRLSLAVSAELAGIPYVALSNAYWSPHCKQHYTVPDLPFTRVLGTAIGQLLFSAVRPAAFALHCLPMFRLRRSHGLVDLGFDLGRVYTHANRTLYADIPDIYDMRDLPSEHSFIGPVVWSPASAFPDWWPVIPTGRPIVYVTLGSSGQAKWLPTLIAELSQLKITALVSTAGAELPAAVPENVYIAKYLPGEAAVAMASVVICNGGSPTTQQALVQGVPVLGIAGNLDQYLNMAHYEKAGVGRLLRGGKVHSGELAGIVTNLLADPSYREAARKLANSFAQYDSTEKFRKIINELLHDSCH